MQMWGANKDVVPLETDRYRAPALPDVPDFVATLPEAPPPTSASQQFEAEFGNHAARPGQEQFHRFYFPFERRAEEDEGTPGGAPFRPFYGHFDVFCDWDREEGLLNNDMSSPNARMGGYSRLNYARSTGRPTGGAEGLQQFGVQWHSEDMSATPHTAPARPESSGSFTLGGMNSQTSTPHGDAAYAVNAVGRGQLSSAGSHGGHTAPCAGPSSISNYGGYATRPSTASSAGGGGGRGGSGGGGADVNGGGGGAFRGGYRRGAGVSSARGGRPGLHERLGLPTAGNRHPVARGGMNGFTGGAGGGGGVATRPSTSAGIVGRSGVSSSGRGGEASTTSAAAAAAPTAAPSAASEAVAEPRQPPGTAERSGVDPEESLYGDLHSFASTWGFSTLTGEGEDRGDYAKYSSREVRRVNFGELGKWIAKMSPRGAGDYKPMCVLLQAVLREMIGGKLRHNNEMILRLRDTVHTMQGLLRSVHDQYTQTLTAMSSELAEEHQMNVLQSLVTAAAKLTAKFRTKREHDKAKLNFTEMEEELQMLRRSMQEMRLQLDHSRKEAWERDEKLRHHLEVEQERSAAAAAAAAERIAYLEGVIAKMHESGRSRRGTSASNSSAKGDGSGEDGWVVSDAHRASAKELSTLSSEDALTRLAAMSTDDAAKTLSATETGRACALLNLMDPARAAALLSLMPPDAAAALLAGMDRTAAAAALAMMDPSAAAAALAEMDPAVAAELLALLDPAAAALAMEWMSPPRAASILRLMQHAAAGNVASNLDIDFLADVVIVLPSGEGSSSPLERNARLDAIHEDVDRDDGDEGDGGGGGGGGRSSPSRSNSGRRSPHREGSSGASSPLPAATAPSRAIEGRGEFGAVMEPLEAAAILSRCQGSFAAKTMVIVKRRATFPHFAAILAGFDSDLDGEPDATASGAILKEMTRVMMKRMDYSELGGEEMDRFLATLSGEAAVSILSVQPPDFVAGTVSKLSVPDGAGMLLDFSMAQRQDVLAAMEPETREAMLQYLNRSDSGGHDMGECVCMKCKFKGPHEIFAPDFEDVAASLAMMSADEAGRVIGDLDDQAAAELLMAMDPPDEGIIAAGVLNRLESGKCQALKPLMRAIDEEKATLIYSLLDPRKLRRYKTSKSMKRMSMEGYDPDFLESTKAVKEKDTKQRPLKMEFAPPPAWLDFLGASNLKQLVKIWEKDGKVQMTAPKCRGMIAKMYEMKISVDKANARASKINLPLVDYVCVFFDNSFGLKKMARQNLTRFIFSIREIYAEGSDPLVCTFVRLCGLYHPLPASALNFLLGCAHLAAAGLSGGGQEFAKPQNFWAQWVAGKSISFSLKKSKEIASMAFIHVDQATVESVVLPAVVEAVEANTTGKEGQYDVPKGKLSLGKFLACLVEAQVKLNGELDNLMREVLMSNADDDGNLTFKAWRAAVVRDVKTHRVPNEGAIAYIFARAHALEHRVAKKLSKAVHSGPAILKDLGEDPETTVVSADSLVSSFNWNYGIICEAGMRLDGTSLVEEAEEKAVGKRTTPGLKSSTKIP